MSFFSLIIRPLPISTLFPYTTLFRSNGDPAAQHPPEASIFMQYAMLAFEMRSQAFLMGGNLLFDSFSIRVMNPLKPFLDRKSTRLNSSHVKISYAVFCLKKKKIHKKA